MERTLDVRGLNCPIPLVRAQAALAAMEPGDTLVVLATDPEAPIDLGALAADHGHALATVREAAHWRLALTKAAGGGGGPAPPHARGRAGGGPAPPHARGGAGGDRRYLSDE